MRFIRFGRVRRKALRELNLKSLSQVELSYGQQRDGLRTGSLADANGEGASRTGHQFGELAMRAWAKRVQVINEVPEIYAKA